MAHKWTRLGQYRKLYLFIGKRGSLYLAFGVVTGVCSFVVELVFAYVLQAFLVILQILPLGSTQLPSWIPSHEPKSFLIFLCSVLVIRGVTQWLSPYLISAAAEIQRDHQRFRLLEWSLRAPTVNSGTVMNLFSEGATAVSVVLASVQSIFIFLSTLTLMWIFLMKLSWITTLIGTAILILIGLLTRLFDRPIRREGKRLVTELEQINSRLMSSIKNLLLLQIYGTRGQEREAIKTRLDQVLASLLKYQKFLYLKSVFPQTLGMLMICGLSIVAIQESWLVPSIAATYFYLFVRFVQNFSEVVKQGSTATFFLPMTIRMAEWWAEHSHDGVRNPVRLDRQGEALAPLSYPIGWSLENVSFRYPGAEAFTLKDISLLVPPGCSLVIKGESGSGKSTLISLLIGAVEPTSGSIHGWNGKEEKSQISEIRESLLLSIGYVGPESFLVDGTILDNLTYGISQSFEIHEVEKALLAAECQFVFDLKDGLDHRITEQGQGLSAGQKQRISLARALLRRPKILILDEATANLDEKTEERLIQTLSKLKGSTTLVIVTHRPALLTIADQVFNM